MPNVIVSANFDDLRSRDIRFLDEAAKLGSVHVLLWSDDAVRALTGKAPEFPQAERHYVVQAIRYVHGVTISGGTIEPDALPQLNAIKPDIWAVDETGDNAAKRAFSQSRGFACHVVRNSDLAGFPEPPTDPTPSTRKKVIVTGCYDWFHSGHVRFFEEVSALGDLYVTVGNDVTIGQLKGAGHPMFKQDERRYICGSIRYVKRCLISTGMGWLDAEPEMRWLKPDIYAVNEDGDRPEKRDYCAQHGIQYVVLRRVPKEGLTRRTSTNLRGF
jgi:cytidyltransferase-like protein